MDKKVLRLICAALCVAVMFGTLAVCVSADEGGVFTVQPKSATLENFEPYEFVFSTSVECDCMLQTRENETYDWGNMETIESGYAVSWPNTTAQFRLWAEIDGVDHYSDTVTVTWQDADDVTEIYIEDIEFGYLQIGYGQPAAVPLTVKNTGDNALRNIRAYIAENSAIELIQNREPHVLAPGETDSETWSVRPRQGLGAGDYSDSVFFEANIHDVVYNSVRFTVESDGAEPVYSARADVIDYGVITESGERPEPKDLVVYANGTGNLTKVHVYSGNAEDLVFMVISYSGGETDIRAGMDSGSTWWVKLNDYIPAGDYEQTVYVYAAELSEPVPVTVKVKVVSENESGDPADGSAAEQTGQETSPAEEGSSNSTAIIIIAAAAAVMICIAAALIIKRKKK